MAVCDTLLPGAVSWALPRNGAIPWSDSSRWSSQSKTQAAALQTSATTILKAKTVQTPVHVATKNSQAMMYNSGTTRIFILVTGDSPMNVDLSKSLASLSEIAILPDNWDQSGASAFSEQLILLCRDIVRFLSHQPDIFPTALGSIQMEWDHPNGDYLEIEIFENGSIEAALRKNDGSWYDEDIDVSMIGEYVEKFFAQ